jgi:hypothetical protein
LDRRRLRPLATLDRRRPSDFYWSNTLAVAGATARTGLSCPQQIL